MFAIPYSADSRPFLYLELFSVVLILVLAVVGQGTFKYRVIPNWPKLPTGSAFREVAGVCVDSHDSVYVFHRGKHPVMVFDPEGNFLRSWGDETFSLAHNIRLGPDNSLYCIDFGDHTVRKLKPDGSLLMTLGKPGISSNTGAVGFDYRTIKRVAGPFNAPTDVAFEKSSSDLFVADGYGNARVHVFSSGGTLIRSWGEPGERPGQFNVLHAIFMDRQGRLLIADRENSRIQLFTPSGEFISQWNDANRPAAICEDKAGNLFVVEMGYVVESLFPNSRIPSDRQLSPRLTIRSNDGMILAQWGGKDMSSPGNFYVPHSVCIDSQENLYIADCVEDKYIPDRSLYHPVQKFVKIQ